MVFFCVLWENNNMSNLWLLCYKDNHFTRPQFVKKCIRCITCHLSTLQLHKVKTRCIIMLSGLSLSADKLTNTLPCLWHFWLILEKSTMTGQIWCNLSLFFSRRYCPTWMRISQLENDEAIMKCCWRVLILKDLVLGYSSRM